MNTDKSSPFLFFAVVLTLLTSRMGVSAYEQTGIASWYGGVFQGRQTANGEVYDTYGYTSAHRTLPFGTLLEVENLSNHKKVIVRVNDRGPFVENRILDLTYAAARDLKMIKDGTAKVRIKVLKNSIPEMIFNIQAGAWRDVKMALKHRLRMEKAGLNPTASLGNDGITRIQFKDVPEKQVFSLSRELEALGYKSLFIYQNRNTRHR